MSLIRRAVVWQRPVDAPGGVVIDTHSSSNLKDATVDGVAFRFEPGAKLQRRMVQFAGGTQILGPGGATLASDGKGNTLQSKDGDLWVNGKWVDFQALSGGPPSPASAHKPLPKPPAAEPSMQPRRQPSADATRSKAHPPTGFDHGVTVSVGAGGTQVSVNGAPVAFKETSIDGVSVKYQPGKNVSNRTVSVGGSTFQLGVNMTMGLGNVQLKVDGDKLFVNGKPVAFE